MKNLNRLKAVCFIYFLISLLPMQAQENSKKESSNSQKATTTWDGKLWDNGKPTVITKAIFADDYIATDNITALEIEVLPEANVTFTENAILRVINDISIAKTGKLIFQENAQLVQKNPNANVASMTFKRKTRKIDKFDYTYFCTPVEGQILNQIADPTAPPYDNEGGAYQPPLFDKYALFNQNATPDPFYTNYFNSGNWQSVLENSTMTPGGQAGIGFIVRGPQSFALGNKQVWWTQFTGVPHSGTKTVPVSGAPYTPCVSTKYSPNFIGNPYPSMLDADSFLSHSSNIANLGGAIYLWTHNSSPGGVPGDAIYNYTANDFVIYNLVGGVGTGRVTGDLVYAPNNYNRPNGKIGMCQGFITRGINPSGGIATFTDAMRDNSLDDPLQVDNQQFFRTSGNSALPPVTKNRFWVSIEGSAGPGSPYKETLVGYMPNTSIAGSTNAYEKAYDTELYLPEYNNLELYTIINSTTPCPRLVIQGRKLDASFNPNDVVHLGFSAPSGDYKIRLEGTEGIFGTQLIWLREQISPGVYTYFEDIRTTGHLFTSTGDVDNTTRFQIVFKLPSLPFVTNVPNICGTVLPFIETTIFTNNISGVNLYNFEVREGGAYPLGSLVGGVTYPGNLSLPYQFNLNFSPIQPATTYWIRPAYYQIDGQWVYGETCQVTTPAIPASCIYSPASGSITTSTWNRIDARIISNQFGFSATSYRFTATVAGNPFGTPFITSTPYFSLRLIGANSTHTNTTFTITVETFWNNEWRPCLIPYIITTANVILRQSEDGISIFEASTYPNPFTNKFKLNINTSSEEQIELLVYDMLGRQMESKIIQFTDLDNQEIGENYASGVYNVILKQGENLKTLRVIKR